MLAQIWNKRGIAETVRLKFGSVCAPIKGERECGDNWAYHKHTQYERVMVADGLGHGPQAAEAAEEAEHVFRESKANSLPELMQAIHNALRKTRGAALALAEFDLQRRILRYVGVGNISATILHNGTSPPLGILQRVRDEVPQDLRQFRLVCRQFRDVFRIIKY